jgi:hypothetical protein
MATPQLIDYHLLMTPDAIVIYPSRAKLLLMTAGGICGARLSLSSSVRGYNSASGCDCERSIFWSLLVVRDLAPDSTGSRSYHPSFRHFR